MIKHLVLSGGGIWGLSCYGALRESEKCNFWKINNIKSIYSTSVGSMIAVILSLKYDWETIDDFLIKRPWSQVFQFNLYSLLSSVDKRGIFEKKCIYDTFDSLFKGKDISLDVTMKEFYNITNIDLHCFSTEINGKKFTKVDFSHSTHPDWKLLDVVYCSSCLPILFSPHLDEDKCYIDGAITNNYPLQHCLDTVENHDEIFGIKKMPFERKNTINLKSSLFDFLLYFVSKIVTVIEKNQTDSTIIQNQLEIMADSTNLYDVYSATSSIDERIKLIKYGADSWENYSKQQESLC